MNHIKPDTLLRIQELFIAKGWNISNGSGNSLSLYDRYCARIKLFSEEQQNLIIDITYNYTRVELSSYLEKFYDSLISLGDVTFNNYDKIFIYPLLSPNKATSSKTKSAGFLHYMFDTDDYTWLSNKLISNSSIPYLQHNFDNNNSLLILVDDFVGSGDTAISICLEYLSTKTNKGDITRDNIKVVSIAAQKEGILAVKKNLNIDVISAMTFEKGISDKFSGSELIIKRNLMSEIEATIDVESDFQFGFKKTEALITMLHKTPNNTFPVYWLETRKKVAPFPRTKKFIINGQ